MPGDFVVLKFGGTSVASAGHWRTIADIVSKRRKEGHRVLLVCSALAGVTDRLEALADAPPGEPGAILDALEARHHEHAAALGVDGPALVEAGIGGIRRAADRYTDTCDPADRAELLAWGEWLSAALGHAYLSRSMAAGLVDAREALTVLDENGAHPRRAWLSARCAAGPDNELLGRWSELDPVLVTQGFVARAADGRTALLGRGGSDTSAALLAGRLRADRCEIWTDVPGLFSADPRHLPGARLVESLDFTEALEMAAGGARVVHPRCLHAAAEAGIPVEIRDTTRPGLPGTRIVPREGAAPEGIKAIAMQPGMAVLLLENRDIRQQVGFLAGVFADVAAQGVSVDSVATSETTTTLAIHRQANLLDDPALLALEQRLAQRCAVTVFPDAAALHVVGRGARRALAQLGGLAGWLDGHRLLMVSQSANDCCLSLLVPGEAAAELLGQLHAALIEPRDEGFGRRWRDIGDDS
ncbi:MAG: aspartate kinase [Xanthomonadales bacterium]|nr:aspartate kinase [Xanthomonadales bacterium]